MTQMTRRSVLRVAGLASVAGLGGCLSEPSPDDLYSRALVIDGNLMPPFDPDEALAGEDRRQIQASGLSAIKVTMGGSNASHAEASQDITDVDRTIARNPDLYLKAVEPADLLEAKRSKRIGIIYSFEAASMHEGRLDSIDEFRRAGVRVMGLSYNQASPFASGVMAKESTGLTDLGRQAIARMNGLGVTVDLSHSDEVSSLAAIEASKQPVLITHAGCSAVHPHQRNKSDAQLRALARRGGVVGIFELSFINTDAPQPTMDDYMAHLTHALDVCGEDHVGIGSDTQLTPFDTGPESMAAWNTEVARRKAAGVGAPGEGPPPFVVGLNRSDRSLIIAREMGRRGYPARVAEKVLGANFARVFRETWIAN